MNQILCSPMYISLSDCQGMLARYREKWVGHEGKVFSLTWLSGIYDYDSSLLSCGPEGKMV